MGVGEFRRRKRRAVDAVAAGAPAHDDNRVANFRFLLDLVSRDDADAPGEDQRVADVLVVEVDGAVDRRDAHAVPVIAHPGDNLLEDALGVDDAFR